MTKKKISIILGIICLVLTYAICIQINTIKTATEEVGSTINDNSDLKDEYLKWQSKYTTLYNQLEEAEKELEEIRSQATTNNTTDEEITQKIKDANNILGLTEVTGEGMIITLDDNRDISSSEILNASDYLVHEEDLIQIVNELFNAGAEAISINDQRITNTTSILCDGNIIRVNDEMVGVPITIKAIGYPERLKYALTRPQGYLELMINDGVKVGVEKSENINISKFEGVYLHEYITRGEE